MALIECSECGKSVSDKATLCPGCGCPIEAVPHDESIPTNQQSLAYSSSQQQEEPWSTGTTIMLGLGTFFIPVIGMFAGVYGVCKQAKRGQGVLLLVISVVATLCYGAIFSVIGAIMNGAR